MPPAAMVSTVTAASVVVAMQLEEEGEERSAVHGILIEDAIALSARHAAVDALPVVGEVALLFQRADLLAARDVEPPCPDELDHEAQLVSVEPDAVILA